jgi:hypothetical protein
MAIWRARRASRSALETWFSVNCSCLTPWARQVTENPTLQEFKISARSTGGNAGMSKSCRDTFALDSFADFRSFRFVWCSAGIDGYGRPLDLKGIPLHRRDLRCPACLRLRGGRSQVAKRNKDLNQVTQNPTFLAATLVVREVDQHGRYPNQCCQ